MAFIPTQIQTGITGNTTFIVPPGYCINAIVIENTTANEITGGIKIGTTNGGDDVCSFENISGNSIKKLGMEAWVFSMSAPQTLYLQAITSWNSANINMYISYIRLK